MTLLLTASVSAAILRLGPPEPTVARASLWMDSAKRGDMRRDVRADGVLSPKEIRWVTAATSASVERILAKPGSEVAADTILMELASPEAVEQLDSARAAVAAARADRAAKRMAAESLLLDQKAATAQIRTALALARSRVAASEKLAREGVVAALTFQEYRLTADQQQELLGIAEERAETLQRTLEAQMQAEQARVDQLQNAYALRAAQAAALRVRAGTAGVLQSVAVQAGQQVPGGANLARVAEPGELRAELQVAETQAKELSVGLRVSVDVHNGLVEGRIERVAPAVLKGNVQVDVELLGPLPADARADMSVEGTIEIEKLVNVLFVPRPAAAVPNSRGSLFRLTADGSSATRTAVRFGRASIAYVEVAEGLAPGDRVVLSDTSAWDGSERIRLR